MRVRSDGSVDWQHGEAIRHGPEVQAPDDAEGDGEQGDGHERASLHQGPVIVPPPPSSSPSTPASPCDPS